MRQTTPALRCHCEEAQVLLQHDFTPIPFETARTGRTVSTNSPEPLLETYQHVAVVWFRHVGGHRTVVRRVLSVVQPEAFFHSSRPFARSSMKRVATSSLFQQLDS